MLISYYRYVLSSNEIWFIVLLYIIIAYLYQNKDNAIFPIQTNCIRVIFYCNDYEMDWFRYMVFSNIFTILFFHISASFL